MSDAGVTSPARERGASPGRRGAHVCPSLIWVCHLAVRLEVLESGASGAGRQGSEDAPIAGSG